MTHTEVEVISLPDCDICIAETYRNRRPKNNVFKAAYDGKTATGPWANMCEHHFNRHGVGLGLGRGQKLVCPGAASKALGMFDEEGN